MTEVVAFVPKEASDATRNLEALVRFARDELAAFGSTIRFDDDVWEVTSSVRSKANQFAVRLKFSNWDTARSKTSMTPMSEPFRSFAKAFVRCQHASQPRANYSNCLTALRALETALSDMTGGVDPVRIGPAVLHRAAQLLREVLAPSTAYNCGVELEVLYRFTTAHRLVSAPTSWRNPIPHAPRTMQRVGAEFDSHRLKKMPSPAAFHALGGIFQVARSSDDILVTSVCALLTSSPSRMSEVMLLPSDCEVTQSDARTGAIAYGLRWRPAKGGAPMVKWVASPMHEVVREALKRLRALSGPALQLVRWYESNPGRLYLPRELEHLRGRAELTMREVSSIVFDDDGKYRPTRPWQWCRSAGVPTRKRNGELHASFADVERAVLGLLPAGFPVLDAETGLRYRDALLVLRRQELDGKKVLYRCMFQPVEPHDVNSRIGPRARRNIFERHGFREDDGRAIVLSSHMFRHYLNTLAQANFMDQLDLARWSGRRNVAQNAAYDHVSDRDVATRLRRALVGEAPGAGPGVRLHRVSLVSRDEFSRLRIPTAHTTEFGYCTHDFSMLPCQLHQDCVNCEEQVCVKGDREREAHVRTARDETWLLLERARQALDAREYGADRWVAHHSATLKRLDNLCAIFDDPTVPDGAVIRLDESGVGTALERSLTLRAIGGADPSSSTVEGLPFDGGSV